MIDPNDEDCPRCVKCGAIVGKPGELCGECEERVKAQASQQILANQLSDRLEQQRALQDKERQIAMDRAHRRGVAEGLAKARRIADGICSADYIEQNGTGFLMGASRVLAAIQREMYEVCPVCGPDAPGRYLEWREGEQLYYCPLCYRHWHDTELRKAKAKEESDG